MSYSNRLCRDHVRQKYILHDHCNAAYSNGFSAADVKYRVIRESDDRHASILGCNFTDLFIDGMKLLSDVENNDGKLEKLQQHERNAMLRLYDFFKNLGCHEESLKKVFARSQVSETDVTIALAEHLLGRLSPGNAYVIDHHAHGIQTCKCGCGVEPKFGNTGIGHEAVWHGHADIVISSHLGLPSSDAIAIKTVDKYEPDVDAVEDEEETCYFTPEKKRKEDDLERNNTSPGGKSKTEVKARQQTIAQTIVFSLLLKQIHPNLQNHLVPNILISSERIQIVMYDADNDVLLCSYNIKLFVPDEFCLKPGILIIIRMVLHYRMFCRGLAVKTIPELHGYRSHFKELAESRWDIYTKLLRSNVSSFPVLNYEGFDFTEDFSIMCKNIFHDDEP